LAETCVFVKQSLEPCHCDLQKPPGYTGSRQRHPFSRSYGASLPSSLTRVLSRAWVSSTRLPVSVCGTVGAILARGFSRRPFVPVPVRCYPFGASHTSSWVQPARRIYLSSLPMWDPGQPNAGVGPPSRVPPLLITDGAGAGISTRQPSPTPLGFGLGPTNLKRTNLP
jgi:hypothetical protein